MAYEDDIRAELALSWVGRSRRKWLEAELAKITASGPQVARQAPPQQVIASTPASHSAPARANDGQIFIEGTPQFRAATEEALRLLQGTPSWVLVSKLRGIRQVSAAHIGSDEIGGYVENGIFHCGDGPWRASSKQYASCIAHEGAHAANPTISGTAAEKIAFKAQAQALRELGASQRLIDHYEAEAANPTHHLRWKGPNRKAA